MVIEPKKTFVAYRCPVCGQAVVGFAGSFAMSADMLRLRCPCEGSAMTITVTPEKKIRLSVPCLFCEKEHSYILSRDLFYGKDIFLLNCSYTGLDVGFIGDEDRINENLARTEREIQKLCEDAGASPDVLFHKAKLDENALPDAQIYDIVRFVVKELEADGAIDCPCHSGSYDFEVVENGIRVFCPDCDAEYIFPADSVSAAQEFLQCDRLDLK